MTREPQLLREATALEIERHLVAKRTRVVAASYVSYFTGQRLKLAQLSEIVRASNALLLLDVTHAAGVVPVEAALADVVVSSCYKWLLATHGVGIFYWNPARLPDLKPHFIGWNTVHGTPSWHEPTQFEIKSTGERFEPGNPTYIGLYILKNALDHLLAIGIDNIAAAEHALLEYGTEQLSAINGMRFIGTAAKKASVISFLVGNIHPYDTGTILDKLGIAVRTGHHCTEPLMNRFEIPGTVRASFAFYNTKEKIDALVAGLHRVAKMFA